MSAAHIGYNYWNPVSPGKTQRFYNGRSRVYVTSLGEDKAETPGLGVSSHSINSKI
jgi:hypothetical protein